jgi:phosphoribosylformimino-5-aminoimidazole carboxamide ribotide isomerase
MIVIPAIDLRDGACVQLVGGDYKRERVRLDPLDALQRWKSAGFRRLHVVDLDAATDVGTNGIIVTNLLAEARTAGFTTQLGGGLRIDAAVDAALTRADYAVVGTRAVDDTEWLATLVARHPDRIIVAADTRDGHVLTHGWSSTAAIPLDTLVERCNELPLAGLLVTAVHREGLLAGPDFTLLTDVVRRAKAPVIASGGITSRDDLCTLADTGIAAAVVGMALYVDALDPIATAQEFAA